MYFFNICCTTELMEVVERGQRVIKCQNIVPVCHLTSLPHILLTQPTQATLSPADFVSNSPPSPRRTIRDEIVPSNHHLHLD